MNVFKFHFRFTDRERLESLSREHHEGIARIDINPSKKNVRVISDQHTADSLIAWASSHHIQLTPYQNVNRQSAVIAIAGMTCRSCEVTLERELQKIEGIEKAEANAIKGTVRITYVREVPQDLLRQAVASKGYAFRSIGKSEKASSFVLPTMRPSLIQLGGLTILALVIGLALDRFNLLTPSVSIGSGLSFGAEYLIGLLAASSSCIAVSGGLLLSSRSGAADLATLADLNAAMGLILAAFRSDVNPDERSKIRS